MDERDQINELQTPTPDELVEKIEVPDPPVVYRINPAKITFRELRFGAPFSKAAIAWAVFRTLGSTIPGSTDDPPVESLEDFTVEESELPEETRRAMAPMCAELEALGFHSPTYTFIHDAYHSTKTCLVTFAHRSLRVVGRVHLRTWHPTKRKFEFAFFEFITAFESGRFLWSLSSKPDMHTPEACAVVRAEKANAAELFRLHSASLAEAARVPALPAFTSDEAMAIAERLHATVRDYFIERGVFTPEDAAGGAPSRVAESRHPDVMAEIERLERRSTSWRAAILILIFSLVVFLGVGFPGKMSFLRLLALVPVLLFHEAGHYIAMRWFGYRNLKMFFIPGFGAAVSGRHYNVAGWKKVVVSLMGPVPGIVVGIAIGACGIYWRSQLAMEASLLMLALNALNLIPILPFDGGHVVRTIIFARHYWLDIGFRAIAAVIVGGLGAVAKSPVLMMVGVGMLVGLPQSLRIARLSRELRNEGFHPVSKDSNTIPPDVADRIVDRLKERDPKPAHARLIAVRTVNIFETLNTKAPGWLASLGLLTVHGVSLVAAVLVSFLVVIAQRGPISDFLRRAAETPSHQVMSSDVLTSKAATPSAVDNVTIAATFKNREAAQTTFESVDESEHSVMLLGDSVLVVVPGSDIPLQKKLLGKFRADGAEIGLSGSARLGWSFSAIGPSALETKVAAQTLKDYFGLYTGHSLTAPWSKHGITPEQQRARRTYSRLVSPDVWKDPELLKLDEELDKYEDKEETPESNALQDRYEKRRRSLDLENARALAADAAPEIDQTLVKKYIELAEANPDQHFRVLFTGAVASQLGVADPLTDPTSASGGFATEASVNLGIQMVSFDHPAEGARALVGWLESKGFRQIRYRVNDWGGAESLLKGEEPSLEKPPGDEKKPG